MARLWARGVGARLNRMTRGSVAGAQAGVSSRLSARVARSRAWDGVSRKIVTDSIGPWLIVPGDGPVHHLGFVYIYKVF
jgi:hypothetical protein